MQRVQRIMRGRGRMQYNVFVWGVLKIKSNHENEEGGEGLGEL